MSIRSIRSPRVAIAALMMLSVPSIAEAAATVEVLENYSPVRAAVPNMPGQFFYASPSFLAYRANVMQGLIQGLTAFGPENSPTRFEAFDKTEFSIFETTGTPFNSWLGDTTPEGAYAGEFGTIIRAALRVESDEAFTINDVFYRYVDDIGNDFGATFGALGFRFSPTFVGRTAGGDLLDAAADDPFQDIVALYFFGFANINVVPRIYPADFAASGQTPEQFFTAIDRLYVDDPYSFSDTYSLIIDGVTVASDALAGDIVQVPEPAGWMPMIGGLGLLGGAWGLRRRLAA